VAERIPSSLLAALTDLVNWLDATGTPSIIIGGVAASILGRPRLTKDIDTLAILPEADWPGAVASAARYGIVPRIENPLDFARRSRVLLMRHTASGIEVDITFGGLAFEKSAIANCGVHAVGGLSIRLPRVEDLLIMKAIAHRPKDMLDIEGLLAAHPDADVTTVRQFVSEFAAAMSMSDMLQDFDNLVAKRRSDP
jgi:hypothetical protein